MDFRHGHIASLANEDTNPELDYLFSVGKHRHFSSGTHLLTEGESAGLVYDIVTGTVAIERNGTNGRRQILKFIMPPDFIGASSTPRYPNLATALTDVTTICYPRPALEKALSVSPSFSLKVRLALTRMLEASDDHVFIIGQRSAIEGVAALLIHFLDRQLVTMRKANQNGIPEVELPMTRLHIADFLGLTIETVSRAFTTLKKNKLISFSDAQRCTIIDLDRLKELGGRDDFTDIRGKA